MENGTSSRRYIQTIQNLNELFKKDDDEVHQLFPKDMKRFRKNKLTSIAISIKKRFSVDYANIQNGCEKSTSQDEINSHDKNYLHSSISNANLKT